MLQTKEDIKAWLDEMAIIKYTINDDLTVDVDGDVYLSKKKLTEIPVQFGIINGNFYIWLNSLKSLKGSPVKVNGSFDCAHNQLESLEYSPYEIGKNFCFTKNPIIDPAHVPYSVGGVYIYHDDNKKINLLNIKITECIVHECNSPNHFINQFYGLYKKYANADYKFTLNLSAQQINSILLEEKLRTEIHSKDTTEKRMKI